MSEVGREVGKDGGREGVRISNMVNCSMKDHPYSVE